MGNQIIQKHKAWRSRAYLNYVKSLPSVVSGLPADDAHHIKGYGYGGSVKAPDYMSIPLTRAEHTKGHAIGWQTWEKLHGSQLEYVARTLCQAIEEGILK